MGFLPSLRSGSPTALRRPRRAAAEKPPSGGGVGVGLHQNRSPKGGSRQSQMSILGSLPHWVCNQMNLPGLPTHAWNPKLREQNGDLPRAKEPFKARGQRDKGMHPQPGAVLSTWSCMQLGEIRASQWPAKPRLPQAAETQG